MTGLRKPASIRATSATSNFRSVIVRRCTLKLMASPPLPWAGKSHTPAIKDGPTSELFTPPSSGPADLEQRPILAEGIPPRDCQPQPGPFHHRCAGIPEYRAGWWLGTARQRNPETDPPATHL